MLQVLQIIPTPIMLWSQESFAVTSPNLKSLILVSSVLLLLPQTASGQDLSAAPAQTAAPAEVAEPIRALLGAGGHAVKRGASILEFWWVKALPLESAPSGSPTWDNVPDGAVVGVVRTATALSDIRGLPMKPGVYTLRFARQPQDGDHMGVSPYREFLLVAPAAEDQSAEPAGYKGAVALAKKTIGKSHPASLSLDPPTTTEAAGTIVTNEAGHKGLVFSVPVEHQGKPAGSMAFGLTLVGRYEH
jgi:hypothetical protein